MAQNLDSIYLEIVQCYIRLETQFNAFSTQEILDNLHITLNHIHKLLSVYPEGNNIYSNALANLKNETVINISIIKKLHGENNIDITKSKSGVDHSEKKIKQDHESIKFRKAVEGTEIKPRTRGLCDIAGLDHIKNMLRTFIISPIKQPQLYEGLKYCNCLLLFGPPGTGKTRLVDAVAMEAGATLLSVTASSILSQYVGQSEKMLRSLFQYIYDNTKKIILFIDEIDGLCRHRIQDESDHSRRLKTEFMCQLSTFEDCKKGYLICATNCPWELDIAFVRRFQKRLYVPLPKKEERRSLLKYCTRNTELEKTGDAWETILERTEGFSGSDITQLVQQALTMPIIQLQENKVWKLIDDKYYEALSSHDNLDSTYTIHYDDFNNLPSNSVRTRKPTIDDLIQALQEVRRTVSAEEVKKYECYVNNYI
ncbi:hypothetical protein Trydic_g4390 [Trypoxylus dichotomus]